MALAELASAKLAAPSEHVVQDEQLGVWNGGVDVWVLLNGRGDALLYRFGLHRLSRGVLNCGAECISMCEEVVKTGDETRNLD